MLYTLSKRIWAEDEGVLTFEWILLITVVIIGIVGGLSAVRDAIIDELGDVAGAAVNIDQSYTVHQSTCIEDSNEFGFHDVVPDCEGDTPGRDRPAPELSQGEPEACKK